MEFIAVGNKEEWGGFLLDSEYCSFLQSWEWGEFQSKGLGKKVHRLRLVDGNKPLWQFLAIEEPSRFGRYLYIPRGGAFDWDSSNGEVMSVAIESLKSHFQESGYVFIRLDPAILASNDMSSIFRKKGFKESVRTAQVERAWMIDLDHADSEHLLNWLENNGLRSKVRKYFGRAERKGVQVSTMSGSEGFDLFIRLQKELASRKGIVMASEDYYRKQFEYLVPHVMQFWYATLDGKVVATALIGAYGDELSYLHGASSPDTKDTGASYYLHWELMKYGLENGYKKYNMWGVVSDEDFKPGHPGYGYSFFKRGFGGQLVSYQKPWEFCYKPLQYKMYRMQERYRLQRLKGTY